MTKLVNLLSGLPSACIAAALLMSVCVGCAGETETEVETPAADTTADDVEVEADGDVEVDE